MAKGDPGTFSRDDHSESRRSRRRDFLASYVRKGGVGAELGVFWGHFSEVILDEFKPRRLYLIDVWDLQGERYPDWGRYTDFGRLRTADCRADVEGLAARHPGVVTVIRDACEHFLQQYTGEKFDWIYLDTSHTYADTIRQLPLIAERLSDDGVILGDDWIADRGHPHHAVFRAVHQFIRTSDFEIVMAGRGNQYVLRRALEGTPAS